VRLRDIEIDSIRSKIGLGESKIDLGESEIGLGESTIDLGESEIGLGESEIGRMLFSILHWPTIFRRI
jgi:hypothetical protein